MAEDDKGQHLDQVLDSLLATYSNAEPQSGLETRILANVNALANRRKSGRPAFTWVWAGAGLAAAAAVIAAALWGRTVMLPQPPHVAAIKSPAVTPAPSIDVASTPTRTGPIHHTGIRILRMPAQPAVADVRQEVFPTLAPLSEQEQLLLRYLRTTPWEEVAAQSHSDKPAEDRDDDQSFMPGAKPGTQQFTTTR